MRVGVCVYIYDSEFTIFSGGFFQRSTFGGNDPEFWSSIPYQFSNVKMDIMVVMVMVVCQNAVQRRRITCFQATSDT